MVLVIFVNLFLGTINLMSMNTLLSSLPKPTLLMPKNIQANNGMEFVNTATSLAPTHRKTANINTCFAHSKIQFVPTLAHASTPPPYCAEALVTALSALVGIDHRLGILFHASLSIVI